MSVNYEKKRRKWYARLCIGKWRKSLGYYETKEEAIEAWKTGASEQIAAQNHPWKPWTSKQNSAMRRTVYHQTRTPWQRWAITRESGLWFRKLVYRKTNRERKTVDSWMAWIKKAIATIQQTEYVSSRTIWQQWAEQRQSSLIMRVKYKNALNKKRRLKNVNECSRNAEIQMRFDW